LDGFSPRTPMMLDLRFLSSDLGAIILTVILQETIENEGKSEEENKLYEYRIMGYFKI
jgi:hypothetical protein